MAQVKRKIPRRERRILPQKKIQEDSPTKEDSKEGSLTKVPPQKDPEYPAKLKTKTKTAVTTATSILAQHLHRSVSEHETSSQPVQKLHNENAWLNLCTEQSLLLGKFCNYTDIKYVHDSSYVAFPADCLITVKSTRQLESTLRVLHQIQDAHEQVSITNLCMSSVQMSDEADNSKVVSLVSNVLKINNSIRTMKVQNCVLLQTVYRVMVLQLHGCDKLRILDLCWTENVPKELADVISTLSSLKSLNLANVSHEVGVKSGIDVRIVKLP